MQKNMLYIYKHLIPSLSAGARKYIHMTKLTEQEKTANSNQQLELFSTNLPDYLNAFHFYESLPRFMLGKRQHKYINNFGDIKEIAWSGDLAAPITKGFLYRGEGYTVQITPASIEQDDGKFKSFFPGVIEKNIENVLFKIANEKGKILEREGKPKSFALRTTYYEIAKELKKVTGKKNSPYSNKQIKKSLEVLKMTQIKYKKDIENVKAYQYISPIETLTIIEEDKQKKGTLEIIFNILSTKAILSREYRPINYFGIMNEASQLGKWLKQRIYMNFTYANQSSTYKINYRVIMNESGSEPIVAANRGIVKVTKILEDLDIVQKVDVKPIYKINEKTGRKVQEDANFEVWPTRDFINEQIKINVHQKWLTSSVVDPKGELVFPPKRADFMSTMAFKEAKLRYEKLLQDNQAQLSD